ncbi:hypothetical protein Q9R34_19400 [Enterobacter sp. BRE11]|nr:hypothetical protein [Enterobacter sp. BRE11]
MSDNEITDIGVMSGIPYGTAPLSADMQYLEAYTSSALNRKLKGVVLPGFYLGFSPVPGAGLNVVVTSKEAEGGQGAASIDVNAHQVTVQHLADLTLAVEAGKTTRIVLEANYKIGIRTDQVDRTSQVKAASVFAQDLSVALAPNQLELCRVLVPTGATQVTEPMIDTRFRVNRQVGITLDSIFTSDDELIAANLKGLKILKALIDKKMVISENGADIQDKEAFRRNLELDQVSNEKQLVASENLADLPDLPAARKNFGLGTAAEADKQVSAIDMTPGALMAVGAFGLGAPSYVLAGSITLLADSTVTERNAFWTLNGTFTDGPLELGNKALAGQLFNMRRWYNGGTSLVQLLVAQGGVMYLRAAGGGPGTWAWTGLTAGADSNGWRKVMDSASMTLGDLLNLGAAKAGDNSDISRTNALTHINTETLTLSENLHVGSQITAGERVGIIHDEASPADMVFVRSDQHAGAAPASETIIMNVDARLASETDNALAGRVLGGLTVSSMPHGGGSTALAARAADGSIAARFWLDGGDGSVSFQGSGGLKLTGGLVSDGAGRFVSDTITLQIKPKTKDKAYYLRGRKSDDTLHWYLGQTTDGNDTVTWGNSIPNTWLTLAGDGTGETNVSTMKFRNNVSVGGNLTVSGGADFTGPVNVLAKGATAIGDLTNAALVVTGSSTDGSQGLTVSSFAPSVSFVDRTENTTSFRWRTQGSYLLLEADYRDNGATWHSYGAAFHEAGHLSLGAGTISPARQLTIGNPLAGNGNMTGKTQIAAMTYSNIGADATDRAIAWGSEMTYGDGKTTQKVADVVEFWANSNIVNNTTTIDILSSFRSIDKSSESMKSVYGFDGRQMVRTNVNRWNLYMQGNAPNYLRGQTIIGGVDTTLPDSYMALSVRGSAEISDLLRVKDMEVKGQVSLISATPYIDFNSSTAQLNDYDARILVDTTDATTNGQAQMYIQAGHLNIRATTDVQGQLVVEKDAHFDDAVYIRGTLFTTAHMGIGNIGTGNFAGTSASFNIGDSDSGFICPNDGVLDVYANNVLTTRFTPNNMRVYGPVVSEDANAFRIRINNTKSVFHRFDGSNYYLLVTNDNDPDGTWNTLRPFAFNAGNGNVTIEHQLHVVGNLVSDSLVLCQGAQFLPDGNVYGSVWGGYLNNFLAGRFVTGVRFAGFKEIWAWKDSGVYEESGYVITAVKNNNRDEYIDTVCARCLQYCISGNWYTAGFS